MSANWEGIQQEIVRLTLPEAMGTVPALPDLSGWQAQADWVRILGDRRVRTGDRDAADSPPGLVLEAVLAALWRFGTVVVLAVDWDGREYRCCLGRARSSEFGAESLRGVFPPDVLDDLVVDAPDPLPRLAGRRFVLKLAGRPHAAGDGRPAAALEAAARAAGSSGASFLAVLAPVGRDRTVSATMGMQRRLQDHVTPSQLAGTDLLAHVLIRMVEAEADYRLGGLAAGIWKLRAYLLADDEAALHRAAGALISARAVPEAGTGPVLDWVRASARGGDPGAETWVRSADAADLCAVPRRPLPGFAIEAAGEFDVPRDRSPSDRQFGLGTLGAGRSGADREFTLPLDDLQRHLLVCGVTGAGKTTTAFHVLRRLWVDHRIPWLVIEPVKGDYWRLGCAEPDAPGGDRPRGLRVTTLGDATPGASNPISLNPFAFPEGIPLSTHIDLLKSVFFAGFVLYAPLPYVLETALVRTYERKGWDLVTSGWGGGRRAERFPTLSDFIETVDQVAGSLGWEGELRANVRTSLLVRLENLRRGGKGLLLDGPTSWSIGQLLDRPTVLELGTFGSDEEKSFVCGLLFGLLAEHRDAEARRAPQAGGLRHVLVIEEAHRLFRRTATDQGAEGGNVRGQAVERLAGLLAEIRAFGQGVIIVDQSPEKLAPDALRNTGTKIVHRLVAAEDRDAVARAASLSAAQERELAVLRPGEAVLAAEGIREPVLVRFPPGAASVAGPAERRALLLADAGLPEADGGTAAPFGERCRDCGAVAAGRCGAVRAQVRQILTGPGGRRRVIPGFWLRAAGTQDVSLSAALECSLEGTAADGDADAGICAAAQLPAHVVAMMAVRQPGLLARADTLQAELAQGLRRNGPPAPEWWVAFQAGRYLLDTCADWCSRPCLYGIAMGRFLKLDPDLVRAARREAERPGGDPERLLAGIEALLQEQLRLDSTPPLHLSACALMILADEANVTAAARRDLVGRALELRLARGTRRRPDA